MKLSRPSGGLVLHGTEVPQQTDVTGRSLPKRDFRVTSVHTSISSLSVGGQQLSTNVRERVGSEAFLAYSSGAVVMQEQWAKLTHALV